MKITIAGYGFVGQAHHELLKDRCNITIVDPGYPEHSQPIPQDTDAVIICVSTPPRHDGACHMDNVYEVIEASPDVPILIKSTISLEGWRMLVDAFPNRMLNFSPEFLRAASAVEDLKNMEVMLIGGTSCNFWANLFDCSCEVTDPEHLILAKYARNSFLALKVSYFNQLYDLCEELKVDFEAVRKYTTNDERIGSSHSLVTQERGFGGHCFPKDVNALIHTARRDNIDLSILKQALEYNINLRKDKD